METTEKTEIQNNNTSTAGKPLNKHERRKLRKEKEKQVLEENKHIMHRVEKAFFQCPWLKGTHVSVIDTDGKGFINLEEVDGGAYLGRQTMRKISSEKKELLISKQMEVELERTKRLAERAAKNDIKNLDGVGVKNYNILISNNLVSVEAIASYGVEELVRIGITKHFAEKITASAQKVVQDNQENPIHKMMGEILLDLGLDANDSEKYLLIRVETYDRYIKFFWSDPQKKCRWVEPKETKENGARVFYHKVLLKELEGGNYEGALMTKFPFNRLRYIKTEANGKFNAGDISVIIQDGHAFLNSQIIYSGEMFEQNGAVMFPKYEARFGTSFCNFWRTGNIFNPKKLRNIDRFKPEPELNLALILKQARNFNISKAWSKMKEKDGKTYNQKRAVVDKAETTQYAYVNWYVLAEQTGAATFINSEGQPEIQQITWHNLELPDDGGLGRLDAGDIISFEMTATPTGKTQFKKTLLGIKKVNGFNAKRWFSEKANNSNKTKDTGK